MTPARRPKRLFESAVKAFGRTDAGRWYVRKISLRADPTLLGLTGGRVSSVYPIPLMLLTTTGAKTGLPRTVPLVYLSDDAGLILVASNSGGEHHPGWYHNLIVDPNVEVVAGDHSGSYAAAEITNLTGRERTWALVLGMNTGYDVFVARAGRRTIPLIRLRRVLRDRDRDRVLGHRRAPEVEWS
jgi:deazaflavin-dependent oxidoreductase (nitroreductase family)